MAAVFDQQSAGEELARALPTLYGSGTCKWFNTRLGFGFLTVTTVGGKTLDSPIEVFVHQSKSHTKGFRSPEDGEDVQFTLLESPKGLERIWVTGPGGAYCIGKKKPQRKDKCYNCGAGGSKGGRIGLCRVLRQWVMASRVKPGLDCSLMLSLLEDYKACRTPEGLSLGGASRIGKKKPKRKVLELQ
ncbi:hypothetical protein Q9966_012343 [Columba livia]|nr:hypothetical protein Q9966_012343 [Columba livia]